MFIIKRVLWSVRRALGLSPTQRLFRDLKARGVRVGDLDALEVFGHTGLLHTVDYAGKVASLEAWEIDPAKEPDLRRNLPDATVKIADSFEELQRTPRRYGLVVVDNPVELFGGHCEHFDLFPGIFRVARESCVLILNVVSEPRPRPESEHLARRKSFYKAENPEQVPFEQMVKVYADWIRDAGFAMDWHFFRPRTWATRAYYLALKINRVISA